MKYLILIITFIAMITDVKEHKIPNRLLLGSLIVGLVFTLFNAGFMEGVTFLLRAVLGILIMIVPYVFKKVGGGDVKLVAIVCAYMNWIPSFYIAVYFSIIGAMIALVLLFIKQYFPLLLKDNYERAIPYALPIHLGVVVYNLYGGLLL